MMKLGVVITGEQLTGAATKLIRAATDRNHELRCFLTDSGVRALAEKSIQSSVKTGQLKLAVCELSMERFGQTVPDAIADAVVIGGQYQDAEIAHWCDRVIVF